MCIEVQKCERALMREEETSDGWLRWRGATRRILGNQNLQRQARQQHRRAGVDKAWAHVLSSYRPCLNYRSCLEVTFHKWINSWNQPRLHSPGYFRNVTGPVSVLNFTLFSDLKGLVTIHVVWNLKIYRVITVISAEKWSCSGIDFSLVWRINLRSWVQQKNKLNPTLQTVAKSTHSHYINVLIFLWQYYNWKHTVQRHSCHTL